MGVVTENMLKVELHRGTGLNFDVSYMTSGTKEAYRVRLQGIDVLHIPADRLIHAYDIHSYVPPHLRIDSPTLDYRYDLLQLLHEQPSVYYPRLKSLLQELDPNVPARQIPTAERLPKEPEQEELQREAEVLSAERIFHLNDWVVKKIHQALMPVS